MRGRGLNLEEFDCSTCASVSRKEISNERDENYSED